MIKDQKFEWKLRIRIEIRRKQKAKKRTVRRSATIEAPAATLICVVSTLELMT